MTRKPWFLYALLCADGTVYTGVTTDLERRLREHNAGRGARYTAGRRPVRLIGGWAFEDRGTAQSAEAHFRTLKRRAKLQHASRRLPVAGSTFVPDSAVEVPIEAPRFCPRCGELLRMVEQPGDDRRRRVCTGCGKVDYRNPKPCAGVLIVRQGQVLLIRRSMEPYKDWWDIPGGFLEIDEHPAEAAIREAAEETGLKVALTDLLGFYLGRYASNGATRRTLNIYFVGRVVCGQARAGDDATDLAWFRLDQLPDRLAFRHTRQVFEDWLTLRADGMSRGYGAQDRAWLVGRVAPEG